MEQVAGVFRARYNRQARMIRVQWFVILVLLLALAVSLVFRPFASAGSFCAASGDCFSRADALAYLPGRVQADSILRL